MRSFLCCSSVYSCNFFLISSASVRSIPFLFYCAHLCLKCSLCISNFLEKISVFPILLFSSISLNWSLRKAFFALLAILWNSAFRWVYLSFYLLPLGSLLLSAICKTSSDNHFAFLHFFFLRMILINASCTVSIVLQVLCLSDMLIDSSISSFEYSLINFCLNTCF